MCNDNSMFSIGSMPNFACGGPIKSTTYSADYFINFFKPIPEQKWMTGAWHDTDKTKFCAMGFLGSDEIKGRSQEAYDLQSILGCNPAAINDGKNKYYQQHHPKHRIMAALQDAKFMGQAKYDSSDLEVKQVPDHAYKHTPSFFSELYGNFDYGKITFDPLPKVEIKEVVKEVVVEKIVEVEKIVYVTVDSKVRELQEPEALPSN